MAYVYRHIRHDKNEPFYIGIGADANYNYDRAFMMRGRNDIWNKIKSKSIVSVEILIDNIDWDLACEKEKEFIALYGRINNGTGILSNLTDGGEGNYGLVVSDETKKLLSKAFSVPIVQYDLDGNFIKVHENCVAASRELHCSVNSIWTCVKKKPFCYTAKGFLWRHFNGTTENIIFDKEKYLKTVFGKKAVSCFGRDGLFIRNYESINAASNDTGILFSNISACVRGRKRHLANGFHFRYDNGVYDPIDPSTFKFDQKGERGPMFGKRGGNAGKHGSDHHCSKRVNQICINTGIIIRTHVNIKEAAIAMGKQPNSSSSISAACKGKLKSSCGFKWEYAKN